MDKPTIVSGKLLPLFAQHYERYLPSAFDDSLSMLEKVNKIIIYMNQLGKLSNDTMEQWNDVMNWVMSDGLDGSIDAKIDAMMADGSLATIIGNALTDLGGRIDQVSSDLTTFETSLNASNKTAQDTLNATLANIKYYGSPEEYGAKGDGTTDDTAAIQSCLNACLVTVFQPKSYKITKTLILPETHSIDGQHAELLVVDAWTNVNNAPDVPQATMLWVKGRTPTAGSEQNMTTRFIKNLRFKGNQTNTSLVGIFCGTDNQGNITQSSCVNYAVYETLFQNITTNYMYNGLYLAEVWGCSFEKVSTPNSYNAGLYIQGQIVNNTFTACQFSGVTYGVYVDGDYYVNGTTLRRPEGNVFLGGFIGQTKWFVQ